MGARGRSPTPTAVLKLHDSWRAKAREKEGEVKPPTGKPLAPPFVAEADKALWEQVLEEIDKTPGLLTIVDGFQLERYCKTLVRWRQVETELERFKTTVSAALMDDTARQVIRSLWAESRACDMQLKQTEAQFGLTPSSRTRIRMFGNFADAAKTPAEQKRQKYCS